MASFTLLRSLALCWPMIHGRALSLGECLGVIQPASGRPDAIDERTLEMREALRALSLLRQLAQRDLRAAVVVCYTQVMCGPAARAQREMLSEIGRLIIKTRGGRKISARLQERIQAAGVEEYNRAKGEWGKMREEIRR